jgi:hypothetical protein
VKAATEEVLARVGFTWDRLERLAWSALLDRMRARGITLDEDRLGRAHELYVEVGLEWAGRYDVALSRGVGFPASCYRRMYPRLTDFLREEHGDARRGTPLLQVPTEPSLLPAGVRLDEESFEQLVESVSSSLTSRALRTLHTVGRDKWVLGLSRSEIRERRGLAPEEVDELLEEVGWQLRRTLREAA